MKYFQGGIFMKKKYALILALVLTLGAILPLVANSRNNNEDYDGDSPHREQQFQPEVDNPFESFGGLVTFDVATGTETTMDADALLEYFSGSIIPTTAESARIYCEDGQLIGLAGAEPMSDYVYLPEGWYCPLPYWFHCPELFRAQKEAAGFFPPITD